MKRRWIVRAVILAAACLAAGALYAQPPRVSLESLLAEMIDPAAVARWPEPQYACRQASSYDRRSKTPKDAEGWFANTDNMDGLGRDLRWETIQGRRECVMMEADGPGAIVRFWSGGVPPKGKVRFYLDGSERPAIEAPLYELFSGRGWVPRPLAIENAGSAVNFYLPVPYARHCKITYDEINPQNPAGPPPGRWFNIEYRSYSPGTEVEAFRREALGAARPLVDRVCKTLSDPPAPRDTQSVSLEKSLAPGKKETLALPPGPGAVRLLELRIEGRDKPGNEQVYRSTVLSADFDGQPTVWCPAGDFFGSGVGLNRLQSWYRTVDKNGSMTCRWVMPYEKSAGLGLENLGSQPVSVKLTASVGPWTWDRRSMHFHTTWRDQHAIRTRPMQDWNYGTIQGKGVYLGDTLAVFNPVANWWGEGDEKIWVDGEPFPSHFGTGSEDYYGYAWGAAAVFQGPFCNQPRVGPRNKGHTTNTRTRSLDAIPFTRSLQCDIEIWHWSDCTVGYSVASYWYAQPGASSNRSSDPNAAASPLAQLPEPQRLRGAIECEDMKLMEHSAGLKWIRQDNYPFDEGAWSGDAQILVLGQKPGDFLELLVAEKIEGPRKIVLYGTKSYDYGTLRFSVNGRPAGKPYDAWNAKPVLTGPIDLGVVEPKDGRIVLRVEVTGANPRSRDTKSFFGLDAVTLTAPEK